MSFLTPKPPWPEITRWLTLLAAGLWLLHPFMTGRFIGTGDALWYANMLADFVTQGRAGVFPIFVGQTEFAFNGAVYPLRVAPLYQHLAGLIDLLTGRQLGFFALQHATVLVCGFSGLVTGYLCAKALLPERPWCAAAFAVLYLSCPGVIGTIYTQDLYMTWMTVPFLPLVFYATVRTWQRDDWPAQILFAAGLAALWWCHSPVALWTTLIAAFIQTTRLVLLHRHLSAWLRAASGAALGLLLGHYPFVSVASLQFSGAAGVVTAGLPEQERITNVIEGVFPAVLLPVSEQARALSDLQLGYGFWLVLGGCLATALVTRHRILACLVAAAVFLLVLLLPVPVVNPWLWTHLAEPIKRITFYWPMHRFYLILAAILAAAGPLTLDLWRRRNPSATGILTAGLLLATGWSLGESRQFVGAGRERTASPERSAVVLLPENRLLMNHAYGLFPALPAYFSNGVMDPRSEARLLARETLLPLPVAQNETGPEERLTGVAGINPGLLRLNPTLRLEPGRRYRLELAFNHPDLAGVLQFSGPNFFREYSLPASGQPLAFGSRPGHSPSLSLWTSTAETVEIRIRFIPADGQPLHYADFARFRLREIDPAAEPVDLQSVFPFRARLRPAHAGWLETPRMFIPGYSATLDGQPAEVRRSPQGLVMVPVEASTREVTVSYTGPGWLRFSYWVSLAAWAAFLPTVTVAGLRQAAARAKTAPA